MKNFRKRRRRHLMAERSGWLQDQTRASMAYDWHTRNQDTGDGLMHPVEWKRWLEQGPCPGCPCEAWCDRICSLRAKWWDDHMARIRRQCR